MPAHFDRSITIDSSAQNSAAIGTGQATRGSFQIPSAFDGANVTVQVSNDGTNFTSCPVEGNEANPISVAVNGTYSFPQKTFNFRYVRLRSASEETAARSIGTFMRSE